MRTAASVHQAVPDDVAAGVIPFTLGLIICAVLIGAVWLGIRVRGREPAPPRPEEQPRLPESGPVREVQEYREPAEVPHTDHEHRLLPHDMKDHGNSGTRPGGRPRRRR